MPPKKQYWKRSQVRSGLESRMRIELDKQGVDYGYETVKLRYIRDTCKHCGEVLFQATYTPDFILHGGLPILVEAKGRFTSSDRSKYLKVKRDNPTVDLRFVFQRNLPLRKGTTVRNSDWARQYGFQFSVGELVPQAWIEEVKVMGRQLPIIPTQAELLINEKLVVKELKRVERERIKEEKKKAKELAKLTKKPRRKKINAT